MMEPETDTLFSFIRRASSSAKARRIPTGLIPALAPLARRKQTRGGSFVIAAHTRRMVSDESDRLGEQPIFAGADQSLSLRHMWKEPEQRSVDGKSPDCARPEVFGKIIESIDHILSNLLQTR